MTATRFIRLLAVALVLLSGAAFMTQARRLDAAQTPAPDRSGRYNPYADHNGERLPAGYAGPRYRLNYRYPSTRPATPAEPPWRKTLDSHPIGRDNAVAYVLALKEYIAPGIRTLVDDYEKWDSSAAAWFDQPWLSEPIAGWPGREPIQGTHTGPTFHRDTYVDLEVKTMQDFVVTYYNDVAAYTLHRIWQSPNPYQPRPTEGQFGDGAIIVKLTMTDVSGREWAPLEGAVQSHVLAVPPDAPAGTAPQVLPVYAMQFDIIVKDRKTSPRTGWVFATLVYDKDAAGTTTWDKMVPLGAMWGNDPGVDSPEVDTPGPDTGDLRETVINPAAPAYAKITLGWGGRLSGPNDGSTQALHPPTRPVRISSCMSCHGTAEFPGDAGFFPRNPATKAFFTPGSRHWDQWFQSRLGTVAQTSTGQHVALDYDMVTRQALINWDAAAGSDAAVARAKRQTIELRQRGQFGIY